MRISTVLVGAAVLGGVSAQRVTVTGATSGLNGNLPVRKNLNDLCSNTQDPQRTLFFRAVQRMQAADPRDPLSWFQIGGIHGRPYISWNGESSVSGGNGRGYCFHYDPVFLPWHRIYSAVYEQSLVSHARQIASEYPAAVRSTWQAAADSLRAPYWDWAADYNIPGCAGASSITVQVPSGSGTSATTISNPLLKFTFPSAVRNGQFGQYVDDGFSGQETTRCPAPQANVRLAQDQLKEQVYDAFTRSKTFLAVSAGTDQTVVPFEQPHNTVHVDAACGNHFTTVGAASFDPLFMPHHVNVDRYWALWEELYPNQRTLSSSPNTFGSFSVPQGPFGPTSHLSPFYGPGNKRYNSQDAASTAAFGYRYEGIDLSASQTQRTQAVTQLVNRLYGPPEVSNPPTTTPPVNTRRPCNDRRGGCRTKRDENGNEVVNRFYVKFEVDATKVPRPCTLKFFIGDEAQPAGKFCLLTAAEGSAVKGQIPLHKVLSETGRHEDMTDDEIEAELERTMKVVVEKVDGSVVPAAEIEGAYTIDVVQAEMTPPKSLLELPKFGKDNHRRIMPETLDFVPKKGTRKGKKGGKTA